MDIPTVPTVEMSVLVEPPTTAVPRTGISPLAGRATSTAQESDAGRPALLEPEGLAAGSGPTVSSRFDFVSPEDEALPPVAPRSRRLTQAAIVVALAAAAASLLVLLPDGDESIAAAGERTERIETDSDPVATAEMLTGAARSEVAGSLQSLASAGRLSRADAGRVPATGTPGDGGDGFATAIAEVVADVEAPPPSPSTTTWTEPSLPPESQWVDSGNGVMVPDLLLRIRFCESTNNYQAAHTNSSARGAYQFLSKSWDWYGHAATTGVSQAHLATPAQQDRAALATLQAEGTGPWSESRSCWADENINPRYATAAPPKTAPAKTTTTTAADGSTTVTGGSSTTPTSDGSTTSSTDTTGQQTSTTDPTSTTVETTTTQPPPTTQPSSIASTTPTTAA